MEMIFLQAPAAGGNAGMMNLIMIAMMFIVVYFFMIRPQAKRQREQQNFLSKIDKGDNIVTASGIHGRIVKVEGDILTIEVYKNTYIRVERSAISKELSEKANATTTEISKDTTTPA